MITSKLQSDFFGSDQKTTSIKQKRRELDRIERLIGLGNQVLALQGAGGYAEFVRSLEQVKQGVLQSMEEHRGSDSDLRVLQGQAQGLSTVLRFMRNAEMSTGNLALKRNKLQNEISFLEQPELAVPGPS